MSAILRALRSLPIYVVTGKTKYNSFDADAAVPAQDTGTRNDSLNAGGALGVTQITDVTGLVPWKDYVPVQQESGRTAPYSYDANGYFPMKLASGGIFSDPHFASVVLLSNFETAGAGNQVDQSSYARTVSWNGSPLTVSASSPLWGSGSVITTTLNGLADYRCADAATLRMGASDFTMECVVKYNATNLTNFSPVFAAKRSTAGQYEFSWYYFNGTLNFAYTTDGSTVVTRSVSWTPSTGVQYHMAVCRSGSNLYFFVNGGQIGATQTLSATIYGGSSSFTMIGDGLNSTKWDGQYDAVRITKGVARYTANFTPPTQYPTS